MSGGSAGHSIWASLRAKPLPPPWPGPAMAESRVAAAPMHTAQPAHRHKGVLDRQARFVTGMTYVRAGHRSCPRFGRLKQSQGEKAAEVARWDCHRRRTGPMQNSRSLQGTHLNACTCSACGCYNAAMCLSAQCDTGAQQSPEDEGWKCTRHPQPSCMLRGREGWHALHAHVPHLFA